MPDAAAALSAAPVRRAAPVKNSDEVPAAVSRRSHLTTSVTAPVAAAVGAKGLVAVAQDLAARRAGDVVVLDRVTRHVVQRNGVTPLVAFGLFTIILPYVAQKLLVAPPLSGKIY